jgi:NADPH-dependent curcumin reductase CurA
MSKNQRILLASRPHGAPTLENFQLDEADIPTPGPGQILLRILYLSLDPYMRGRMDDAASYAAPVPLGGVMEGGTVAQIVTSNHPGYTAGEFVLSHSGWQSYAVSDGAGLRKLDPSAAPLSTALGILGMPGFTAYAGLLSIGKPQPGETVVVAAATGPVGATVAQIAKLKAARAIGIAGGPDKCAYLRDELKLDAVIDHRSPTLPADLAAACPNGIDVYFENVSGPVWDAVFPLLNQYARIPVCGLIANYNSTGPAPGPDRLPALMRKILTKSLTIRGFIQFEFASQRPDFYRDMTSWITSGDIKYREDVIQGLTNAPNALIGLLQGQNFGKLVIQVADPA